MNETYGNICHQIPNSELEKYNLTLRLLFYKSINIQSYQMSFVAAKISKQLTKTPKFNKISYNNGNPYNLRWQYKWKHAYYTYPKDTYQHTHVAKPEDSPAVRPLFWPWIQDVIMRFVPSAKRWYERKSRWSDNFQLYVLPATSLFFYQFSHLNLGFAIYSFVPMMWFYTRMRDRSLDPDLKQTYLFDDLFNHPEISKYFSVDSTHILDYDLEYDQGYPSEQKFPQFKNKFWRFFNKDTHMCTGFYKFGDVESGATMTLKMKTMPVPGKFKYQVGQPFFFYDLRAEINHNGVFQQIVLADENQILKQIRPFLIIV